MMSIYGGLNWEGCSHKHGLLDLLELPDSFALTKSGYIV